MTRHRTLPDLVGEYSQYTCLKGQPQVWERDYIHSSPIGTSFEYQSILSYMSLCKHPQQCSSCHYYVGRKLSINYRLCLHQTSRHDIQLNIISQSTMHFIAPKIFNEIIHYIFVYLLSFHLTGQGCLLTRRSCVLFLSTQYPYRFTNNQVCFILHCYIWLIRPLLNY